MAVRRPYEVISRRQLLRSRRSLWFAGVCGGLGERLGIAPCLLRLAFVLSSLFGGFGLVAYIVAWIVIPMEPEASTADADRSMPGLRGIATGVVVGSATLSLYLLAADRTTMELGTGIVAAPAVVAIAAAIVRDGRMRARLALVTLGLVMTGLLAVLNFSPTVGDRSERPTSPMELTRGYSNAFGTMTIDLTALGFDGGHLGVKAKTAFGDLIVRVPPDTEVRQHGVTTFWDAHPARIIDLDLSSLFGSVTMVYQ